MVFVRSPLWNLPHNEKCTASFKKREVHVWKNCKKKFSVFTLFHKLSHNAFVIMAFGVARENVSQYSYSTAEMDNFF